MITTKKNWNAFESINLDYCAQLWTDSENERFDAALEEENLQELETLYNIAEERAEAKGNTIELS